MLLTNRSEKLISAIHQYQKHRDRRGPVSMFLCRVGKLRYMFWTITTASDINRDATIAPSVRFPHLSGIVIHRDTVIEEDCLIMQQVTLGQTGKSGAPHICKGAYIGAGAKVIGAVRVGQRARVGANAVVVKDVPDDATAVGVPARIIQRPHPSDEPPIHSSSPPAPNPTPPQKTGPR